MVSKETEHLRQELKDTRKVCLELEEALATEVAESEKQAEQMQRWNRQLHEKTLALDKSLIGHRATSSSLETEKERSSLLAAELVTVRSQSQTTIRERDELIFQLTSALDQEARARAALQASLDQEQVISFKLRMRANKVASDLKRDLTSALVQQRRAPGRHSQQLEKVREQTLSLERNQAARPSESLSAQAAEDKTLCVRTDCRQEETTVKDSLLASLTQRAEQLVLELTEEQDKSITLQMEVRAALSDKMKMMEELDIVTQESQQQKESLQIQTAENKRLSSQMQSLLEETSAKDALLALEAERRTSELTEHQNKNVRLQGELQAAVSDNEKLMEECSCLAQEIQANGKTREELEGALASEEARSEQLTVTSRQQRESLQRQTAENERLSSQMEVLLEETSGKGALLALMDSEAERLSTELIEHRNKSVRLQGELQAAVSDNDNSKHELAAAETTAKTASEQLKALKEQLSDKALALEKSQSSQRDLSSALSTKITQLQKSWDERVEKLQLRSTEMRGQAVQTLALSSRGQAHSLEARGVLDRNQNLEKKNTEPDSRMSKHQRVLLSKYNLVLPDHSSKLQKDHDTLQEDHILLQKELDVALADIAYFKSSSQTLEMNCRNLEAHQHTLQGSCDTLLAKNLCLQEDYQSLRLEKLSLLKQHQAMKDHYTIQGLSILDDMGSVSDLRAEIISSLKSIK